ncbi:MAG: carbohydrate binding domain-containing protein [Bacteroidaceae bacterium]|nr:carbohydrate binding domain-containing protein [Bacteroidaceae bacterium]
MKLFLLHSLFAASMMAGGNNPDSVYIRPSYKEGTMPLQLDYSIDQKHWTHIPYTIFSSDYGPWGSEKKLHSVVLRYDGKKYYAEFIPSPKNPQVAITESENLVLWKPQDYPTLPAARFEAEKEKLAKVSKQNVLRIPYRDLEGLLQRAKLAQQNAADERENIISSDKVSKLAKEFVTTIDVDLSDRKAISPNLYGIFFEDISYAADGGLYAELVQNRDFEYTGDDHKGWNAQTAWRLEGSGAEWSINTADPIHSNNKHYVQLHTTQPGALLLNEGFDGIPLKQGAKYDFSFFLRGTNKVRVSLRADGQTLAETTFSTNQKNWQQLKAVLTPKANADKAALVIEPLKAGEVDIDFVSLFPQDTYKGHKNGLRRDLAEMIADLHPRFVRFPGGCASHGQGIDNIYHWQATIGPLWERQPDMNIWNYHQSRGLGFYEYFQYCEDIGAEPLPVLAAGVPCQNSWRGGNGQQGGIPFEKDLNGKPSPYIYNGKPLTMESYLQELLDLIEWANGDAKTSPLARLRAEAGHPKPFNLKYLGIGNEDLISDTFKERYFYLIDGVKKAHPEITVVGTVGPFWEGSDYEYGWKYAKEHGIEIVDEHYYNTPGWYFHHQDYYDNYSRTGTKVYLGEWASKGNYITNALVEALYLTNVERNADVVVMSSYAPLLAREGHTNWNPDMIYFTGTKLKPTCNYFVHRAFGQNAGDEYVYSKLEAKYIGYDDIYEPDDLDLRVRNSVVIDSKTGDIIVKLVSVVDKQNTVTLNLGPDFDPAQYSPTAQLTLLSCANNPNSKRQWDTNETRTVNIDKSTKLDLPGYTVAILRIQKKGKKQK